MFPRPSGNQDFMLYPEPPVQTGYASPPMEGHYSPENFGFPHAAGFEAHQIYAEQHFPYNGRASPGGTYHEDAELRVPSSNLSTISASSSTVGSPHSNHGHLAFVPDYNHNPLGVNPSIVGQPDYYTGSEYSSFVPPSMEEYTLAYDGKPGFVGELAQIPRSHAPSGSFSFTSSSCTLLPPGLALDTDLLEEPPTPISSPRSRKHSIACASPLSSAPSVFSPVVTAGPHWSSPSSADEISPVTPSKAPRVSFFSQSSGHFVAPLGSYCWFPLSSPTFF